MKKKFFDCGTHYFEGFKEFVQMYNIDSTWECFCFEANPYSYEQSKIVYNQLVDEGYNIQHFNKAVSNQNTTVRINCAKDGNAFTNQGSNILSSPPLVDIVYGGKFDYEQNIIHMVETIDFSEILSNNCAEEDFILVKMDIEGSEFGVIDKLIDTATYKLISEVYIEFHERFFPEMQSYIEKKLNYKRVFTHNNIKFEEWR